MTEMSLRNIDSFTHQEIFDFVAEKLLAQGKRSVIKLPVNVSDTGVRCSYHNEACDLDGPKCAVGHLLSPEEHRRVDECDINGLGVSTLISALGYNEFVSHDTVRFLNELQTAHDNCYDEHSFSKHFAENMRIQADNWDLNTTKLDELALAA